VVNELDSGDASLVVILKDVCNDSNKLKVLKQTWPTFMKISVSCHSL
jgi:hypothetical protein